MNKQQASKPTKTMVVVHGTATDVNGEKLKPGETGEFFEDDLLSIDPDGTRFMEPGVYEASKRADEDIAKASADADATKARSKQDALDAVEKVKQQAKDAGSKSTLEHATRQQGAMTAGKTPIPKDKNEK